MKRILTVLLACVLCFTVFSTSVFRVFAYDVTENEFSDEEMVDLLLEELTELKSKIYYDSSNEDYKTRIQQIDEALEDLGVCKLTSEELYDFLLDHSTDDSDLPLYQITKPTSTSTVTWYLYTLNNQPLDSSLSDSPSYDIQRLIAVGNNPGGMLITTKESVALFKNKSIVVSNILSTSWDILSIYIQKAIGLIPVLGLTPYELLFSSLSSSISSSSASVNNCYFSYHCISTLEFTYVKDYGASDDDYSLTKCSNKATITVKFSGLITANSATSSYDYSTTLTTSSTYYGSLHTAMVYYSNNSSCYDYISSYTISAFDDQFTYSISLPNPLLGPGQIY